MDSEDVWPLISVIMPTYNSAKTLDKSLESIRKQKYPQNKIEILIVDGGSTDETLTIAQKYKAKIVDNPLKLPEAAKAIGIRNALGEFLCLLDSDEYLLEEESFKKKIEVFKSNISINAIIIAGVKSPKDSRGIVRYANAIGDPYSNYVYYKYDGTDYLKDTKKHIHHYDNEEYVFFKYSKSDLIHPWDAKGCFYRTTDVKRVFEDCKNDNNTASILTELMIRRVGCMAIIKNDYIIHENGLTNRVFGSKIRWRIINNIFGSNGGVGYTSRARLNSKLRMRKYFFVVYCMLLFPPIIDSLRLIVKYRDLFFITHFFWTEYTFFSIAYYFILKALEFRKPDNSIYG